MMTEARSPANTPSGCNLAVSKSAEIGIWLIGGWAHRDGGSPPIIGAKVHRTRRFCP